MRNPVAESYHPLLFLRRFIAYLQETIIYEFPWFVRDSKTFEILEAKRHRASITSKHVAADLLTLLAICGFLVVLILVSIRCPKDDEDQEEEEEGREVEDSEGGPSDTANETNEIVTESIEGSMYSLPLQSDEPKDNCVRHDCGDSALIPHMEELPTINFAARNFLNFPDIIDVADSETSALSVRETTSFSPERQQMQHKLSVRRICSRRPRQQQMQRNIEREWLIRRTRSGQIYGRYQI